MNDGCRGEFFWFVFLVNKNVLVCYGLVVCNNDVVDEFDLRVNIEGRRVEFFEFWDDKCDLILWKSFFWKMLG